MSEVFPLNGSMTEVSYQPAPMSFEQWQDKLTTLERVTQSLPWWIGDLLIYGQDHYGEQYAQALPELPYKQEYLYQCHYLARMFETERRRADLSWSHHVCVMSLSADQQDALLEEAAASHWTVRDLRNQVKMIKHQLRESTGHIDPLDPDVADWFRYLPEQCVKLYVDKGGHWEDTRLINGKTVHLSLSITYEDAS